ncbi:MAG: hypothetical protein JWN66_1316 [Sphingomonas bacterium]|uniref:S41 family peptidase n=1 Tax=Sphingomonas bacterium TaxID=1895847 RepID=UPI0026051F73|nr:S41 family peptidase [Sphingomonas bacterium]MDB5704200.1 hypothetical protein [Sphingomonas bacterium]
MMISALLPLLLAAAPADRDWPAALRQDAQALHDDAAANHPGPINRLDPDFARRNDAGLALALKRAGQIHDFAGYLYAMRAYVASFEDGHMGFGTTGDAPKFETKWPGFLTSFDIAGVQRVVSRADGAPLPLGARLVSCDGRRADRLAAENVGAFEGRWFLKSRHIWRGGELFVDRGNPFIKRPVTCVFAVSGKKQTVTLDWQPIAAADLSPRLAVASQVVHPPVGPRTLADGTRWFNLGDFNGDPSSEAGRTLPGLIAAMKTDRAALIAAPAIILDLRGNNGGSSDWSRQIAAVLWGEQRFAGLKIDADSVEWRASEGNIASLSATRDARRAILSPEALKWFDRTIAGMQTAHAKGEALWRDTEDQEPPVAGEPPAPPRGPVYFITDSGCGSACLDAADLWQALGAIHIGQETSADTLYMDVRQDVLPSGVARMSVPMKVYRGRKRGSNVPLDPVHVFPGNLRDTPALEAWVATLPERQR